MGLGSKPAACALHHLRRVPSPQPCPQPFPFSPAGPRVRFSVQPLQEEASHGSAERASSIQRAAVLRGGRTRDARSGGWGRPALLRPRVAGQVFLSRDRHFLGRPSLPDRPPGLHWACPAGGSPYIPTTPPALAGPPPGAPTTLGPALGSRESSRVRCKLGRQGWGLTLRTKPSGQARSYLYTL